MVNSFIQNLDTLGTQSIVIAATNHEELLDSAIWRRFSYRLALSFPSMEQRQLMWAQFLLPCSSRRAKLNCWSISPTDFPARTFAKFACACSDDELPAKRDPELKDAFQVLQNMAIGEGEERRFLARLRSKDEHAVSTMLRQRNAKFTAIRQLRIYSACRRQPHTGAPKGVDQMANETRPPQQDRLPIKLIMPKQGTERRIPPGGTPPKPFRTVDAKYRSHLSNQVVGAPQRHCSAGAAHWNGSCPHQACSPKQQQRAIARSIFSLPSPVR